MRCLSEAPWLREEVDMPIQEVVDEFRHIADKLTVQKWEKWCVSGDVTSNADADSVWDSRYGYYDRQHKSLFLRVVKIRWKAINYLNVKLSPNSYEPEMPFTKIVDNPKEATSQYAFNEVYQGVWIADKLYDMRPKPNQVRDQDDYAKTHLDYFGSIKNGQSVVDITINLWVFACIIMYHIEAMLNRSGGKAVVYDIAQKPANIPLPDVFYHAKESGVIVIDTSTEGSQLGRGFNQFQQVDFTLSQTVNQLIELKAMVEQTMQTMTGINPNRTGEGHRDETNKNNEQKIIQSNYITQAMFAEHFRVVEDVMNEALNLTCIVWDDDNERILKVFGERGMETIKFLREWIGPNFGLWVKNSAKEKTKKRFLMGMAERAMSTKELSIRDAVKMANASSSKEVERIFDNSLEEMQKMQQKMQEGQSQQAQEMMKLEYAKIEGRIKAARIEAEAYIQTKHLEINAEYGLEDAKAHAAIKQSVTDAHGDMQKIMLTSDLKEQEEARKKQEDQAIQQQAPIES
jgi:hypothetical protein